MMVCFLLALASLAAFLTWYTTRASEALVAVLIPPLILLLSALFMVRGYVLTNDEIIVKRLGWVTRLPLEGLVNVAGDDAAMTGSLKLFGSSGFMSYTGVFWNRKIGRYRAFATDPARAVVLSYPARKVVVTPDDPQRFIVRARSVLKYRTSGC